MVEENNYTNIDEVREADIIDWLAYLRNTTSKYGKPYSSRTIETYSRDVTVFFSWLAQHGYLDNNPTSGIRKMKVERALIRVFSDDELQKLQAACDRNIKKQALTLDERKALAARDRAFLWFLLSTGVRLAEACGLLFSDIDWDAGMVYIHGKGAKERKIPFGKVARQHLDTYVRYWRAGSTDANDRVFLNVFGDPLSAPAGGAIFARLKRVAGITDKRVSPHTCRHWFAFNCIKNGMPTIALKEILGHENWDMIEVYVHLAEQDNKDLYDRFSPVDMLEMHNVQKNKREKARGWRNARKKGGSA
jgi:site-specific recombinase XerD